MDKNKGSDSPKRSIESDEESYTDKRLFLRVRQRHEERSTNIAARFGLKKSNALTGSTLPITALLF
jgi:hypothetical protein